MGPLASNVTVTVCPRLGADALHVLDLWQSRVGQCLSTNSTHWQAGSPCPSPARLAQLSGQFRAGTSLPATTLCQQRHPESLARAATRIFSKTSEDSEHMVRVPRPPSANSAAPRPLLACLVISSRGVAVKPCRLRTFW